jgi:hypothetical protein
MMQSEINPKLIYRPCMNVRTLRVNVYLIYLLSAVYSGVHPSWQI